MSINVKLSQDQVNKIIASNPETYFQAFRDDNGTETIDERSTFPEKLKFYMKKSNKSVGDMVEFLSTEYPLIKSKASIQHYLSGVRTPKLSVVFAIAECLEVAPASLLPGVPGKYIDYVSNHVEMLDTPTYIETDIETDNELEDLFEDNLEDEESLTAADLEDPEVDEWDDFPISEDMNEDKDNDELYADGSMFNEDGEESNDYIEEDDVDEVDDEQVCNDADVDEEHGKQEEDKEQFQEELDEIDRLMASILGD